MPESALNPIPDFTPYQAKIIQNYYSNPLWPTSDFTYPKAAGFLFAVACEPDFVPPDEWLPVLLTERGHLPDAPETLDETEAVVGALLSLDNWIQDGVREGQPTLPCGCSPAGNPMDDLAPGSNLSQWSQGFLEGHDWVASDTWISLVHDGLEDEIGPILMVLTFFATREMAEGYWSDAGEKAGAFDEMAGAVSEFFARAMAEYANLAVAIRKALEENPDEEGPDGEQQPPSRNGPCPCGSGKKYKGCCGKGAAR
jgi:yecA family protein